YCVQRIRAADVAAQKEGRRVLDGEVLTACQAACPAEAIVFGGPGDPGPRGGRRQGPPPHPHPPPPPTPPPPPRPPPPPPPTRSPARCRTPTPPLQAKKPCPRRRRAPPPRSSRPTWRRGTASAPSRTRSARSSSAGGPARSGSTCSCSARCCC